MFNFLGKLFSGKGGSSPIKELVGVVDGWIDTKEEKRAFFRELYEMEANEKANARSLYEKDSILHKIYAIVFLLGYLSLTGWLLWAIKTGEITEVTQFETGMLGSIWGAMSSKVNTITDFLFGASDNKGSSFLYETRRESKRKEKDGQ